MVDLDEPSTSSKSVVDVTAADRRGNNSIKATSPVPVRTNPRIVKNNPYLLGLATMGRDCGCGIVGASPCLRFLLLRFDVLAISVGGSKYEIQRHRHSEAQREAP